MSQKKRRVSWNAFHDLVRMVSEKLPDDVKKLPMLTLGRGGVAFSGILQYTLDNRRNQILGLESYTKDNVVESIKIHPGGFLALSEKMLLIDDLVDSGATVEYVLQKYPAVEFTLVTLFKKDGVRDLDCPHYFGALAPADTWIEMPWD